MLVIASTSHFCNQFVKHVLISVTVTTRYATGGYRCPASIIGEPGTQVLPGPCRLCW